MPKILKHVTVNNAVYTYIENPDSTTTVDGVVIRMTPEIHATLSRIGGLYKEMLETIHNNETVQSIVSLTVTRAGMESVTGFFITDETMTHKTLTNEPNFSQAFEGLLARYKVPFEKINTLEFLKTSNNDTMLSILDGYYSPTHVEDTGFVINERTLEYGETLVIRNAQEFADILGITGIIKDLNIQSLEVKTFVNGLSYNSIIGEATFIDPDGVEVPLLKGHYYKNIPEGMDYDTFARQYELDLIHSLALETNKSINKYPNEKTELLESFDRKIGRIIDRNKGAFTTGIDIETLLEASSLNLVEFKA